MGSSGEFSAYFIYQSDDINLVVRYRLIWLSPEIPIFHRTLKFHIPSYVLLIAGPCMGDANSLSVISTLVALIMIEFTTFVEVALIVWANIYVSLIGAVFATGTLSIVPWISPATDTEQ
jgi:hypothetical protein